MLAKGSQEDTPAWRPAERSWVLLSSRVVAGFSVLLRDSIYAIIYGMSSRIVVDTNVLVGAALRAGGGDNRKVLRRCLEQAVQPLIGAALFHEYEDLFGRTDPLARSPLSYEERQKLLAAFLSVCEWVKVYYLWRPNLPDEADNHLVELAIAGGADAIVTNNVRDFRRGELRFPHLRILTPSEFLGTY